MNKWATMSLALVAVITASCTRPVQVSLTAGRDYSGLWSEYAYSHVGESQWAAVDVSFPADVARSLRRWQLNNVVLRFIRCGDPQNSYPASATLNGRIFDYEALKDPLPSSVKLTFYLPKQLYDRERYSCAVFDARGYSPIFLRSEVMPLPRLSFAGEPVPALQ